MLKLTVMMETPHGIIYLLQLSIIQPESKEELTKIQLLNWLIISGTSAADPEVDGTNLKPLSLFHLNRS